MSAEPDSASAATLAHVASIVAAPPRRWRSGPLLCWALFLVLLAGTGWATVESMRQVQQRRADAFAADAALLQLRFEERLDLYRNLSRTLLGFFQASHSIDQPTWRTYVRAQQLELHYPFLRRIWFAFEMGNELAPAYLRQRPQGAPPARLWPWRFDAGAPSSISGTRRLPLLYLFPDDRDLLGLDLYGRAASSLERAYLERDTVLAPAFQLLGDEPPQLAFLTPLFRQHELAASATPSLEGVVGVSLAREALFRHLLDGAPAQLSLEVYTGDAAAVEQLIFDSDRTPLASMATPPHHLRVTVVEYDRSPLTLVFHAPRYWPVAGLDDRAPLFVAIAGLLISLLGFSIARALESTRQRATVIADRMTQELRQVNAVLARMATTDSLTGLLNRRAFGERLDAELRRSRRYGEPCALLMFDIDHFKRINDSYGHPAGDVVLRTVGDMLRGTLRGVDSAGRVGGEEFAVLLPHTTPEQAFGVAESLRLELAGRIHRDGEHEFQCTASFGVAAASGLPADSAEILLKRADQALYRAKAEGRNRVLAFEAEPRGSGTGLPLEPV